MMTGRHRGERLGACTDCRRFWARYRSGDIDAEEISALEGQLAVTAGTCAVMGTASTMALLSETLGMTVANSATIPAVHADRLRAAEESGALAARLVGGDRHAPERHDGRRLRQCVARSSGHFGFDQRPHPSHRHRRTSWRAHRPQAIQPAVRRNARAGQPQAGRRRLYGGPP